jgi:hypothetical protein
MSYAGGAEDDSAIMLIVELPCPPHERRERPCFMGTKKVKTIVKISSIESDFLAWREGNCRAYWNKERRPGNDFLMTASVGRTSVMVG